jgi:hypothetical protein
MKNMHSTESWVKRFLWMTGMVFMILMGVDLLKGGSLEDDLSGAFGWALVSAAIFTGTRYYHARKNVACALCKDSAGD